MVDYCFDDATGWLKCTHDYRSLSGYASLMSYCDFCPGGINNVILSFGGYRTDATTWVNDETLVSKGFSVEPYRIAQTILQPREFARIL